MTTCSGHKDLVHTAVTFRGRTCPVCKIWKDLKRQRELSRSLANKLLRVYKLVEEKSKEKSDVQKAC